MSLGTYPKIPEWLQPYKNEWRSESGLRKIAAVRNGTFSNFFAAHKESIRSTKVPCKQSNTKVATHYLVKSMWAVARANGVELFYPPAAIAEEWEIKIDFLQRQVITLEKQVEFLCSQKHVTPVKLDEHLLDVIAQMSGLHEPTTKAGVYLLLDQNGSVLYVGQSKNVLARMSGHQDKDFATVRMFDCESLESRLLYERRLIKAINPPLNITGIAKEWS